MATLMSSEVSTDNAPVSKHPVLVPEIVDSVRIICAPSPFQSRRIDCEIPAGGSIADMLVALGLDSAVPARVFLNDSIVPTDNRRVIFPRPGDILTVRVIPTSGNRKDLGIIVQSLAVISAVVVFAAGGGPFGASLAFSAVSTIGNLLIKALVPPPKPPTPRLTSTPQTYTVSAQQNTAAPFSAIPKIYGARQIFPQYAASPYSEILGEDQYLRMIFLLGYGPLDISQIQIGNTAIEDFEDIEWELRGGFLDDSPSRLYPGSVVEDNSVTPELAHDNVGSAPTLDGWIQRTSGTNADELSVDVTFDAGLSALSKDNGSPIHIQCTWQIQWRQSGTTTWNGEPDIILKSTARGTTRAGHIWRVQRGQYDVQMQLFRFTINGDNWTNPYSATAHWTGFRTIRAQAPYAMAGLAMIAVRIKASQQLNGVIDNLNCVASSILPDYNSSTGLWTDRAGGWSYDYDNAGLGASGYGLDATNAHTTTAVTDKQFVTDFLIGTADGTTTAFTNTLTISSPNTIQPGSLIISCGTQASATSAPGTKKKSAAVAALAFISDDGQGNIVGPTVLTGTINYTTGALSITFTVAPPVGADPLADFTVLVQTPGAGRALAITTATSSDQAAVVSKSMGVTILPVDGSTGSPPPTAFTVSGWYKGAIALSGAIRIRVFWGATEDFAVTAALSSSDIITAGNATTSYQQASASVTAPSGANWMRVAVYHLGAGTNSTVYYDDLSVKPNEQGVTALEELANPSFDSAGRITSNPASHYRDILQGRANKLAVADLRVDLIGLQNWWLDNETNSRNFNGILDTSSTVFDSLKMVASFARASFTVRDSIYSIVEDKVQPSPIQHFTPRNSWGFKWSKGFPNLPQALKVRYINPGNNWAADERIVYDDNPAGGTYTAATTSLYEVLDLTDGCTDYVQAWKDARYHLAQGRLRGETYEWFADVENIVCQHGDLVYLSHDVPEFGLGAGRIKSVQLDGSSNCTGITTDELFNFDFGAIYVARVRRTADGTSLLQVLNNPASAVAATITSTASGAWATCRLSLTGKDGPPLFRSFATGPIGTGTSMAKTMPSGTVAGDLIIVQLMFKANPGTITAPSVWSFRRQDNDPGSTTYQAIFYKIANASEPSTYAFSWVNSVQYAAAAVALYNVADDNPIEMDAGAGFASSSSASPPTAAPSTPQNSVIVVLALQNSSGTLTLTGTSVLWSPGGGVGGWYYAPSSVATGVLTFQTAIPAASPQPSIGDLMMFGLQNLETDQVLITKIEPAQDLSARLTAVDYAPAVYNADALPPTYNSQGSAAPTRPVPVVLSINSSDLFSVRAPDGSIEAQIMIALNPVSTMLPDAGSIIGVEYQYQTSSTQGVNNLGTYSPTTTYSISDMVQYGATQYWVAIANGILGVTPGTDGSKWTILDESSPWTVPAQVPASTTITITGVEVGIAYNLQLRYCFIDGSRSDWSSLTHTVAGQTTLPPDVTGLIATPKPYGTIQLDWTEPSMRNVRKFEIRQGATWASAALIGRTRGTTYRVHDLPPDNYTFWVGTIDTSGNYSGNPVSIPTTVPTTRGNLLLFQNITVGAALPWAASTLYGLGQQVLDTATPSHSQQVVSVPNPQYNQVSGISGHGGIALVDFPHAPASAATNEQDAMLAPAQNWIGQTIAVKPAPGLQITRGPVALTSDETTSSIVIGVPSGVQSGDLLIAHILFQSTTTTISSVPAGWTSLRTDSNSHGAFTSALYWRSAGASEPPSYTWGFSGSVVNQGAMADYPGADTISPINVSGVQASTTTGGTGKAPPITPTTANTQILCFYTAADTGSITLPSGMSGAIAPPFWGSSPGAITQDNNIQFQMVAAQGTYNQWVQLTSLMTISGILPTDTIQMRLRGSTATSNYQPGDKYQFQFVDGSGNVLADGDWNVVGAQSTLQSSGRSHGTLFEAEITGVTGSLTAQAQIQVENGSGSGTFSVTVLSCELFLSDRNR